MDKGKVVKTRRSGKCRSYEKLRDEILSKRKRKRRCDEKEVKVNRIERELYKARGILGKIL